MNPIARLNDGRHVLLNRRSRTHADVIVNDDGELSTVGHIRTETKPRKNAATTQALTMRYGRGVARSMGFGDREVHQVFNARGRRIGHDYDRINDAALALVRSVTL